MSGDLGNPAVATGLEKVSFNPSPKEGQCQRKCPVQTTAQLHLSHTLVK